MIIKTLKPHYLLIIFNIFADFQLSSLLENMKNIVSFTRFFKKDMYRSPLYGKEWNWRNIKMETREIHID